MTEAEIGERIQHLPAEEVVMQMGVVNQYPQTYVYSSVHVLCFIFICIEKILLLFVN